MWDRLLPWSYVAQREESQGHSLFCATFCWNNWEKNSTPRIHLAPFSTVLFISPNCLFLKSTVTPGKRKLSFQTVAPVLILQQANHDFTNTSLFFALPARYQDDLISAQAGSPCDTCLAKRHHRQRSCYYCTGWWLGVESHGHPCQLCESGPYHDLQLRELSTQTHRAFLSSSMMLPPGMTSQLFATSLTSLPAHINFFGLVVIERI